MTDWDFVNVIGRPDLNDGDPHKGYVPVPRAEERLPIAPRRRSTFRFSVPHGDTSKRDPEKKRTGLRKLHWDLVGRRWKEMGWSDEDIERKFLEW